MKINHKKAVSIVILLLAVIYIYQIFPRKFNKTYKGIKYRLGSSDYVEEVTVVVEGSYAKKFLLKDKFSGTMTINNNGELTNLYLNFDKYGMEGILASNDKTFQFESYGIIHTEPYFEKFTIRILEDEEEPGSKAWNSGDGLMLSAPADTREEALEISKNIMKDKKLRLK